MNGKKPLKSLQESRPSPAGPTCSSFAGSPLKMFPSLVPGGKSASMSLDQMLNEAEHCNIGRRYHPRAILVENVEVQPVPQVMSHFFRKSNSCLLDDNANMGLSDDNDEGRAYTCIRIGMFGLQ